MSNLLTVTEVAKKVQVQTRTVRAWIKDGKLSGIKLPGGDWRFREEHLDGWLNKRTVKAKNAL